MVWELGLGVVNPGSRSWSSVLVVLAVVACAWAKKTRPFRPGRGPGLLAGLAGLLKIVYEGHDAFLFLGDDCVLVAVSSELFALPFAKC